ncbi:hypothetical protein ABES02_16645 [Neobacillus pocheonensis]|uniref:hypothetical protein n=1 Tax=Neobacillus pocheonensis TaxID=363869 RepID=UPI003D2D987B
MKDKKRTFYNDDTGEIHGIVGREPEVLLSLYLEILPGLLSAYHRDQQNVVWTPTQAIQAIRDWAIEVIEELCLHHGITKHDLMTLLSIQ